MSPALEATRISLPGMKNSSMPLHESVMTQAAAPAASKTLVGGENPIFAMDSRLMFRTIRAEELITL